MAIRNTKLVIKNSDVPSKPFSGGTFLQGEAFVNTADGIMMFSGITQSTSNWTPAGLGGNANFFEVGSNLYDLQLRNRITKYENTSGSGLVGKFLSGTTNGFVLADITNIQGIDSFVTGGTYNNATFTETLTLNNGQPNVTITGITGIFSTAFTYNNNTFTLRDNSGVSLNANFNTVTGLTVNGNLIVTGATHLSGGTYLYAPLDYNNLYSAINLDVLTSYTQTNDVYVTGSTLTAANNNTNVQTSNLLYHGTPLNGPYSISTQNTFTTGGTFNNTTKLVSFKRNDGTTGYTVDLSSIDINDTYVTGGTITTAPSNNSINGVIGLLYNQDVAPSTYTLPFTDVFTTGFTYNSTNNTFTLKDNSGNTFNQSFNSVSGLTFSNLTAGRVVYVGAGGLLTDEAGFTYDASTNTFSVPSDGTVNVGTGGLNVAGDTTIQGSLKVFGPAISAFTSQLYVEDDNITLNYNPTGATTVTSVGAGWTIQDGSGIANTATTLNIGVSYLNANLSPNTEYTAATGNENRNFYSPIGDIIIRNTNANSSAPNGVRLLAEGDILSGGSY